MELEEILDRPLCGIMSQCLLSTVSDRWGSLCAGKGSTEDRKHLKDMIYIMANGINEVFLFEV